MINTLKSGLAVLLLATCAAFPALAGSQKVLVDGAWSRASIGVNRPGAAYMTIRNTGKEPVTLSGIRTDLAMMPEVHRSSTDDQGMSSMTPEGDIEIAPGGSVALEPGGLHAMLMRLQRPMKEGDSFTLTLIFSDGGEVTVEVPILGFAARGPDG